MKIIMEMQIIINYLDNNTFVAAVGLLSSRNNVHRMGTEVGVFDSWRSNCLRSSGHALVSKRSSVLRSTVLRALVSKRSSGHRALVYVRSTVQSSSGIRSSDMEPKASHCYDRAH